MCILVCYVLYTKHKIMFLYNLPQNSKLTKGKQNSGNVCKFVKRKRLSALNHVNAYHLRFMGIF